MSSEKNRSIDVDDMEVDCDDDGNATIPDKKVCSYATWNSKTAGVGTGNNGSITSKILPAKIRIHEPVDNVVGISVIQPTSIPCCLTVLLFRCYCSIVFIVLFLCFTVCYIVKRPWTAL